MIGILSGCAPIVPAPTFERVIIPLTHDSPRVYHYNVRSGDTLYAISRLHGITVDQIAQMNDIAAPYVIHPGQKLVVDRNLIAVPSNTGTDSVGSKPKTSNAIVASNNTSTSTPSTSKPAPSGVKVTKLSRPPKRQEDAPSNVSQSVTTTQDDTRSAQHTAPISTKSDTASFTEETPIKLDTTKVSSESSGSPTIDTPLKEESPKTVEDQPSTQPSTITTSIKSTQQKDVSSSLTENSEPKKSSFVARTEPTEAPAETSTEVDIDSLPKGWTWPVSANPTNSFGKDDGLNYFLNQGNQVVAAASGRVTYAGVALGEYKYMVLIKTPDEYVIQYDFNTDLTVKENDLVSKGQNLVKIVNSNKGHQSTSSDKYRKVFFAIWKKGVPQNPNKLIGKSNTGEI